MADKNELGELSVEEQAAVVAMREQRAATDYDAHLVKLDEQIKRNTEDLAERQRLANVYGAQGLSEEILELIGKGEITTAISLAQNSQELAAISALAGSLA